MVPKHVFVVNWSQKEHSRFEMQHDLQCKGCLCQVQSRTLSACSSEYGTRLGPDFFRLHSQHNRTHIPKAGYRIWAGGRLWRVLCICSVGHCLRSIGAYQDTSNISFVVGAAQCQFVLVLRAGSDSLAVVNLAGWDTALEHSNQILPATQRPCSPYLLFD